MDGIICLKEETYATLDRSEVDFGGLRVKVTDDYIEGFGWNLELVEEDKGAFCSYLHGRYTYELARHLISMMEEELGWQFHLDEPRDYMKNGIEVPEGTILLSGKERALFHLENAIACLKWDFEEDAKTNAIEAQQLLKGAKFADLVEGKDYIDLEKRTANSNMIGHPEGVEEGDIVEYRYYPDPKMHRAIVAWNAEEGRYVLQTFRREEVNQFKADEISDYCDLEQADEIIILGSTHQM